MSSLRVAARSEGHKGVHCLLVAPTVIFLSGKSVEKHLFSLVLPEVPAQWMPRVPREQCSQWVPNISLQVTPHWPQWLRHLDLLEQNRRNWVVAIGWCSVHSGDVGVCLGCCPWGCIEGLQWFALFISNVFLLMLTKQWGSSSPRSPAPASGESHCWGWSIGETEHWEVQVMDYRWENNHLWATQIIQDCAKMGNQLQWGDMYIGEGIYIYIYIYTYIRRPPTSTFQPKLYIIYIYI